MDKKKYTVNILVKGGTITPSHLTALLNVALENGNTTIGFGSRQQILFDVFPENREKLEYLLKDKGYEFEWVVNCSVKFQNIVSSFVSYDILPSTYWVTSDTYLTALDQFKQPCSLRVNIVDAKQQMVPCYNGHLNFVVSQKENYWHLAIKNIQNKEIYTWPVLVHHDDMGSLAYMLENYAEDNLPLHKWYDMSLKALKFKHLKSDTRLPIISDMPEYYEGFNRMEAGKNWWAGFLWRNNQYTIEFLLELCDLCLRTNGSRIGITPWKSLLVKDIEPSKRIAWEQLTGRFGINMRHSSFDLYWHLPYGNNDALRLKRRIVKKMDKLDIRTYGLTFSVGKPIFPFTTVLIKEKKFLGRLNIPILNQYDIYKAKNFETASGAYELVKENITYKEIHHVLIAMSKKFYIKLSANSVPVKEDKDVRIIEDEVHQCKSCLSIYHASFGDNLQAIPAGTDFKDLPKSFSCSTCGAPKAEFEVKQMDASMFMEANNE